MVLTNEGKIMVIGRSTNGALGLGKDLNQSDTFKQLDIDTQGAKIVKIDAGDDFNLALDEKGRIYSWGYNRAGQLAHQTGFSSFTPSLIL